MNAPNPVSTRLAFELTPEEARVASSRAALRRALAGGLMSHLAPLAAFVLAMAFTAILASTGLISRRHGEIALLLATAGFMIHRLWTRRRFARARRESAVSIETMRAAGPFVLAVDERGLTLTGSSAARWNFLRRPRGGRRRAHDLFLAANGRAGGVAHARIPPAPRRRPRSSHRRGPVFRPRGRRRRPCRRIGDRVGSALAAARKTRTAALGERGYTAGSGYFAVQVKLAASVGLPPENLAVAG